MGSRPTPGHVANGALRCAALPPVAVAMHVVPRAVPPLTVAVATVVARFCPECREAKENAALSRRCE